MRIGLDFDNTIVCYGNAIRLLADEILDLPDKLPRTKNALRDYLRSQEREIEWTLFQGELYGPGMQYAEPFQGAIKTMQKLLRNGHDLVIVSHRTIWPYAGPKYNLHIAARSWIETNLQSHGLFCGEKSVVEFLESSKEKVRKIAELDCNAFVDDLPEVLCAKEFPCKTMRILFDPDSTFKPISDIQIIKQWVELDNAINK